MTKKECVRHVGKGISETGFNIFFVTNPKSVEGVVTECHRLEETHAIKVPQDFESVRVFLDTDAMSTTSYRFVKNCLSFPPSINGTLLRLTGGTHIQRICHPR